MEGAGLVFLPSLHEEETAGFVVRSQVREQSQEKCVMGLLYPKS